ncbi:TPA: hypothetical protein JD836_18000 [Citrobacter freundii]|nr:hypothetical protein [Salmonella enterica]ECI3834652.1 hypothetical protein [Salmonella enterica subsp. enterica]HAU6298594.1 hypothetical protein [Citrobacter freundii]
MFLPTLSSPVEDFSFQFVEVFHFVASPVAENLIKRNQISNTPFVKLQLCCSVPDKIQGHISKPHL